MVDQQGAERKLPDPMELSRTMTEIAEQSQRLVTDFLQKQSHGSGDAFGMSDLSGKLLSKDYSRLYLAVRICVSCARSWIVAVFGCIFP